MSFAAALVVFVVLTTANRQPGQSETGSDTLTASQRVQADLDQAATLEDSGNVTQAASVYQAVLRSHPDNEVALAQLGWIEFQIGQQGNKSSLIGDGRSKLARAVSLNGSDYAARLYLGSFLLEQDADYAGAVEQYRAFLGDHPPSSVVQQAAPVLRTAFTQAGQPLPPEVPRS